MIAIQEQPTVQIAGETIARDMIKQIEVSREPELDWERMRHVANVDYYKPGPEIVYWVKLKDGRTLTETRPNRAYR